MAAVRACGRARGAYRYAIEDARLAAATSGGATLGLTWPGVVGAAGGATTIDEAAKAALSEYKAELAALIDVQLRAVRRR